MKISFLGFTLTNEPPVYGLDQARASAHLVKDDAGARIVIGTVEGLGYKNTVAAESAQVIADEKAAVEESQGQIAALKRKIAGLETDIAESQARTAEVRGLARFAVTGQ